MWCHGWIAIFKFHLYWFQYLHWTFNDCNIYIETLLIAIFTLDLYWLQHLHWTFTDCNIYIGPLMIAIFILDLYWFNRYIGPLLLAIFRLDLYWLQYLHWTFSECNILHWTFTDWNINIGPLLIAIFTLDLYWLQYLHWTFIDCNIYIGPLLIQKAIAKVKHISTANIGNWCMLWKILLLPSNMNSCMTFRLAYLHLNVTHSKGHSQGLAHLDCKYLWNLKRYGKRYQSHH